MKKIIKVNLAAITRMEHTVYVEVDEDFDEHAGMGNDLAREMYDEVDAGEFQEDPEYWERGDCYCDPVNYDCSPDYRYDHETGEIQKI